jgi:hypothetical protein
MSDPTEQEKAKVTYFTGHRESHEANWSAWLKYIRSGGKGDFPWLGYSTILDEGEELEKTVASLCQQIEAERELREKAEAAFEALKIARFDTEHAAESLAQMVEEWFSTPPENRGPHCSDALRSIIRRRLERILNAPDFRLSAELAKALGERVLSS